MAIIQKKLDEIKAYIQTNPHARVSMNEDVDLFTGIRNKKCKKGSRDIAAAGEKRCTVKFRYPLTRAPALCPYLGLCKPSVDEYCFEILCP